MRDRWRWPINALMGFSVAGCTPASPLNVLASRNGLEVSSSIAYAKGPRQTLDVYRPRGAQAAPVVIFFYGGSWQGGTKETYPFVATALARKGYVTVVPDYRVYPEVRFPAFLEDGAQVVRWVKQNATEFGGDPERVIVMGHSAGAHVAAMLALDGQWLGALGLDPLDVITRNLVPADAFPYRTASGALLDSGNYQEAIRRGVDEGALMELKARRAAARIVNGAELPKVPLPWKCESPTTAIVTPWRGLRNSIPNKGNDSVLRQPLALSAIVDTAPNTPSSPVLQVPPSACAAPAIVPFQYAWLTLL